ncbi:MAG: phytanoyl-CoA dioxygenase family protein [Pseudomonadota bacterium]
MTAEPAEAAIARQDLERLNTDGAVRLTGAIPMSWVEALRQGVERGVREPGPLFGDLGGAEQPGGFYVDTWTRDRIPEFDAFVRDSDIATIAARCLGEPRVRLMQDTWFVKRPGTIERTPWHHDNVIFGPFLSIWVALDPIPRECSLEFVRGSHTWKRYFMPQRYFQAENGDDSLPDTETYYDAHNRSQAGSDGAAEFDYRLEPIPDIEANRAQYDIMSWDMAPGDCLIFHALTLHGAPGNPNATEARRFVTRWVGSRAVLAPHGEEIVKGLQKLGFDVPIGPGDPIRGELFPLLP